MRVPWRLESRQDFPPVWALCAWQGPGRCLPDFKGYFPAKKEQNVQAARDICEELFNREVFDGLAKAGDGAGLGIPIVVTPSVLLEETGNVLARTYGQWLARELKWEFAPGILQLKTQSRDFSRSGWFRLAHEQEFEGEVKPGRAYLIADDVMAMGGTLAALRGFIEQGGGHVFAMTTLASRDGGRTEIALAETTLSSLRSAARGELTRVIEQELGYAAECLTEAEGAFILRASASPDQFRDGLHRARNP